MSWSAHFASARADDFRFVEVWINELEPGDGKRKRVKKISLALAVAGVAFACMNFSDEMVAYQSGTPVRLVSYTGALEESTGQTTESAKRALLVLENPDGLHIIVRSFFYNSNALARPYLTYLPDARAELHINTKTRFSLVGSKCEFRRQFEVFVPSMHLKGMKWLHIINHDSGDKIARIPLADSKAMAKLLATSRVELAKAAMPVEVAGC